MTVHYDDYDSPWKDAIAVYFDDFMDMFFPNAYGDVDWSQPIVVMAHLKTQETKHDSNHRHFGKYYLIRHLYDRGYGRQEILNLFRFIDWMMRLPADLEREWIAQVAQLEAERHMQYVTSVERFAIEEGRLLTYRFGDIPERIQH